MSQIIRSRLLILLAFPRAAQILALVSFLSLAFALTMQFGFGLNPCILCLWQRAPFIIVLMLSLLALLWKPEGQHTRTILYLCGVIFFIGSGLAFFHTGVEQHWWLGTTSCSLQPLSGESVEDIRAKLLHTVVARCDEIAWTFLGLSMANWNVPFSFVFGVFAGLAAHRYPSRSRAG